MRSADVSPAQGQEPLARRSVNVALAPYFHSSRPNLTSQFRGPYLFNETEEERLKREEEEKKSNFKKVQEKAEREEQARKDAEAERDALRKEKAERDANDKAAATKKLEEEGKLKEIADLKTKEAEEKAAEAASEKTKREAVEAELATFKKAQQEELDALMKEIPEDKKKDLPIDDSMTVPQKLKIVKHAQAMTGPKPPVGGGARHKTEGADDRKAELEKKGWNKLSEDESLELAELMQTTE